MPEIIQACNLEDLSIIVGICKPEPYVRGSSTVYLEGTRQPLDSLLAQELPAFKWMCVITCVSRSTIVEGGNHRTEIFVEVLRASSGADPARIGVRATFLFLFFILLFILDTVICNTEKIQKITHRADFDECSLS